MKVKRASYIDNGILIPGVLIERLFRRPVFYSADARCGWESQVIYKDNSKNVVLLYGSGSGRSVYCNPKTDKELTPEEMQRRVFRKTLEPNLLSPEPPKEG